MDIGARLKDLRESYEMTQAQLARRANLPSTAISKIENGSREVSATEAFALSQALNISPNQFYGIEPLPLRRSCSKGRKVQRLVKQLKKTTDDLVATLEAR